MKPDLVTMNAIILAHAIVKNKDGALSYFNDLILNFHLKPNARTLNILIQSHVRSGAVIDYKSVKKILELFPYYYIPMDSHTYMQLLLACKYNKNPRIRTKFALATFDDLLRANITPSYYHIDVFKDTIGIDAFNEYVTKNKKYFDNDDKYDDNSTTKRRPINIRWNKVVHKIPL